MNFHNFVTVFDVYRKEERELSPSQLYEKLLNGCVEFLRLPSMANGMRTEINRHICERQWYGNQQPYYKVYPAMIDMLTGVGLDIPCEYVKLPFDCFAVHFPTEDNPFILETVGRRIESMLVFEGTHDIYGETFDSRRLFLWIHTGEYEPITNCPILNYINLELVSGSTVTEQFRAINLGASDISTTMAEELVRIAVSICFLATGSDKLVSPDVLSKDVGDYLNAIRMGDDRRKETIEQRAVRRGKKGWNVGVGERFFIRPRVKGSGDGQGHELTYSHMRCCHFRILPHSKIPKFIRPTIVRPDLPPKSPV